MAARKSNHGETPPDGLASPVQTAQRLAILETRLEATEDHGKRIREVESLVIGFKRVPDMIDKMDAHISGMRTDIADLRRSVDSLVGLEGRVVGQVDACHVEIAGLREHVDGRLTKIDTRLDTLEKSDAKRDGETAGKEKATAHSIAVWGLRIAGFVALSSVAFAAVKFATQ